MPKIDTMTRRHKTSRGYRRLALLRLEPLERRQLLTTYTVTNTFDNLTPGSLLSAIEAVNNDTTPDFIDFNLPGTGLQTITLNSALPVITNAVTIDGTTALGTPQVAIDGSNLTSSQSVLDEVAGSCTFEGLAIVNSPGNGILLDDPGGDLIQDCYVGTADGTAAAGNGDGIVCADTANDTISGNVISGDTLDGILMQGATSILVEGNTIGANLAGTGGLAGEIPRFDQNGVDVQGCNGVTIGGPTTSQRNLISGNDQFGINLGAFNGADNNATLVEGNIIGLNRAGTSRLLNGSNGIQILQDANSTIGGTIAADRNLISGNGQQGIYLGQSTGELIEGNYIGTDVTGTESISNAADGILIGSAFHDTIGGSVVGAGNLISGNVSDGIGAFVIGYGSDVIAGNYVGVDSSGTHALPNGNVGVSIPGLDNCTVGGTTAAAANIISGNDSNGMLLQTYQTLIEGNYIGTDPEGDNLGNNGPGIADSGQQNTIGGTTQGVGNVIAFNTQAGIYVSENEDSILSNSIYDNAWLGISLGDGQTPTPNDLNEASVPSDANNNGQNYPVLSSATTTGSSTTIEVSLNAAASTQYLLQFFASPQADASGYGEGQLYLGSESVTTSATFNVDSTVTLATGVPLNWVVSATATDPLGDTSEFAQDIPSQSIADVAVTIAGSPAPRVYVDETYTYSVTVSQNGPADADGINLTDNLPKSIAAVMVTSSVHGVTPTISDGVVTMNLGYMAANTTATLTIVCQPIATAVPQVFDSASVTNLDIDPDQNNNIASLATPVDPAADLVMTLQGTPTAVYFDDTVTYTLTATNFGPSAATDVVVTDTLPQNITSEITATTSVAGVTPTIAGGTVTADFGTLALGASATVTITVQPTVAAVPQIEDSVTISTDTFNPHGASNPAPVTTDVLYPELEIGLDWTGSAKSITSLVLSFNDPLVAANADNPANYALVNVGRDGIFGTRDDRTVSLLNPAYNASNWTVTLTPVSPLPVNQFFHLFVNGTSPSGLVDLAGGQLSGAGPGQPGTSYTAMLAQGTNLRYYDAQGDKVTLTLKKGGYLKDTVSSSGEGARLIVVGEHPRRTVLTGELVKAKHSAGLPTLGYTIYGMGEFGDVQVNMKDPPFVVTRYPFSPGSPIPQPPPVDARLARPVVTRLVALKKLRMSKPDAPH